MSHIERLSDLAFERCEAVYEAELHREKEEAMYGGEHQKLARMAAYAAVVAECSVASETREPVKRTDGCRHTFQRMTEWIDEGACPICAVAAAGGRLEKLRHVEVVIREVLKCSEEGLLIDEHLHNKIEGLLP